MSITTTMIWDRAEKLPALDSARDAYIAAATLRMETDGRVITINDHTFSRVWSNTDTAAQWTDFITTTAATNGRTVTVTTN